MVFGTGLYGKVDLVGETSIQTKFFHIAMIPLIPLSSHYFLEGSEKEDSNLNILVYESKSSSFSSIEHNGLNRRSVLIGYIRTISGLTGFFGILFLIAPMIMSGTNVPHVLVNIFLSSFLIIFYLTYKWGANQDIEDVITRQFSERYFGIGFNPSCIKKEIAGKISDSCQVILNENTVNISSVLKDIDDYDSSVVGVVMLKLKSQLANNNEELANDDIQCCMDKLIKDLM